MEPFEDVTGAELAVLQVLWDQGTATIRQLTDVLYPGGTEAHYATVQKLLDRLEEKGHVRRERTGHAHRFRARTDRDTLVTSRLRAVAEKLCGGAMTPLLTHLIRGEGLSARERQDLRALIDDLDRKKKSKS
jgi:predicted transcriptional regulator